MSPGTTPGSPIKREDIEGQSVRYRRGTPDARALLYDRTSTRNNGRERNRATRDSAQIADTKTGSTEHQTRGERNAKRTGGKLHDIATRTGRDSARHCERLRGLCGSRRVTHDMYAVVYINVLSVSFGFGKSR